MIVPRNEIDEQDDRFSGTPDGGRGEEIEFRTAVNLLPSSGTSLPNLSGHVDLELMITALTDDDS